MDLVHPPVLFLSQIQYGLRLWYHEGQQSSEKLRNMVALLLAIPDSHIRSSDVWQTLLEVRAELVQSQNGDMSLWWNVLICVWEIIVIRLEPVSENKEIAEAFYSLVVDFWHALEDRRAEAEQKKNATYRFGVDEEGQEIDELDQLQKELFQVVDLDLEASEEPQLPKTTTSSSWLPDATSLGKVVQSHGRWTSSQTVRSVDQVKQAALRKGKVLMSLLKAVPEFSLPLEWDSKSEPIRNLLLQDLDDTSDHLDDDEVPNFYAKNIPLREATKARTLLVGLSDRLTVLIERWPDHPILEQCVQYCRRILSFSQQEPLTKFLVGIELLLHKSEEWEAYASREFSIKESMDEMVTLIMRWRKMELESWKHLLDAQHQLYAERVHPWWFRLYRVLMSGSDGDVDEHAKQLFSTLNEFLLTSSIGEFPHRLQLLRQFHRHMELFSDSELKRNLLWNLHQYYSQFMVPVEEAMLRLKIPLEKEIREFARLASWRDTNILSLKKSAEKSHLQLAKVVRKYRRDVLDVRLSDVVARHHQQLTTKYTEKLDVKTGDAVTKTLVFRAIVGDLPVISIPELQAYFERFGGFENLLTRVHRHGLKTNCPSENWDPMAFESLSVSILERVQEFQVETKSLDVKINDTKEKETLKKQVKNLKKMKQNALTELFKILKGIGLSRAFTDAQDPFSLAQQECLPAVDLSLVKSCDSYYYRILARMETMQSASQAPKVDGFATQRMTVLMKSCCVHVQQQRAYLARVLKSLDGLQDVRGFPEWTHLPHSLDVRATVNALHLGLQQASLLDKSVEGLMTEIQQLRDQLVVHQEKLVPADLACASVKVQETLESMVEPSVQQLGEVILLRLSVLDTRTSEASDDALPAGTFLTPTSPPLTSIAKKFLDLVLVVIQDLRAFQSAVPVEQQLDEDPSLVKQQLVVQREYFQKLFALLRVDAVADSWDQLYRSNSVLPILIPFFQAYQSILRFHVQRLVESHRATCKLAYILCNLFTVLLTSGFCVPEGLDQEDDDDDAEGEEGDASQGMGMAEGQGKKDVSDQIEDEEQVLGLQDQLPAPEEQQQDAEQQEDQGMEMQNDFDGALEDVPKQENDHENPDQDEEESQEMEERMGDLENQGDVVDEKLWNDDDADEDAEDDKNKDKGDEKVEEDSPVSGDTGETEMAAKTCEDEEDTNDEPSADKKKDDSKNTEDAKEDGKDAEEEEQDAEMQDDLPEENHGIKPREAMPGDDDEDMHLPDDMQLDGDQEEGDGNQEEQDGDREDQDEPEGDVGMDGEESAEDVAEDKNDGDDKEEGPIGDVQDAASEDVENQEENTEGETDAKEEGMHSVSKPHTHHPLDDNAMKGIEESPDQPETAPEDEEEGNTNTTADQAPAANDQLLGVQGKETASTLMENNDLGTCEKDGSASNHDQQRSQDQQGSDLQKKDKQAPQSQPSQQKPSDANPHRSLAEALDTWKRRLDALDAVGTQDQEELPEAKRDDDAPEDGLYEFMQEQDLSDQKEDAQVLAAANEEQWNQQKDKLAGNDQDPSQEDETEMNVLMEEESEEEEEPPQNPDATTTDSKKPIDVQKEHQPNAPIPANKKATVNGTDEVNGADEETLAPTPLDSTLDPASWAHHSSGKQNDQSSITSVTIPDLREQLESKLLIFQEEEPKDWETARQLWSNYERMTHDLSMALCEQLRLILEPTLTSKLKGDYRTGKRLNMKKIVPYIASQFKKDKIWLRRTKPSKRQYQVLLCVDDSKSMAGSVQLAYESLALISKALTQLEIGQLGVMSFGESVSLLHPFDRPFSEESGANVLQRFTFRQEKTHVHELMASSLPLMEQQRAMASGQSATDLWQLQIILSDGLCEEHDALRRYLQEASEKRILVVFVILDRRGDAENLLKTKQVSFVDGKLVLRDYMDSFPFEYYVLLRDIQGLPDVLANALQQWLEVARSD